MIALGLMLGLMGCGEKDVVEVACGDSSQCEAGQGCQDGTCITATCFATEDCPLGSICDEASYACIDGCLEDSDCFAGQGCDAGACVEGDASCETTEIDCPLGHECSGGECSIPDDPFCMPCDAPSECAAVGGSEEYGCYELTDSSGVASPSVCGVPCEADSECPQGFWCSTFDIGTGIVSNCIGPCDQL